MPSLFCWRSSISILQTNLTPGFGIPGQCHPFSNPGAGIFECRYAPGGREIPGDGHLCKGHCLPRGNRVLFRICNGLAAWDFDAGQKLEEQTPWVISRFDANLHRDLQHLDAADLSPDQKLDHIAGLLDRLDPSLLEDAADWADEEIEQAFLEFVNIAGPR